MRAAATRSALPAPQLLRDGVAAGPRGGVAAAARTQPWHIQSCPPAACRVWHLQQSNPMASSTWDQ